MHMTNRHGHKLSRGGGFGGGIIYKKHSWTVWEHSNKTDVTRQQSPPSSFRSSFRHVKHFTKEKRRNGKSLRDPVLKCWAARKKLTFWRRGWGWGGTLNKAIKQRQPHANDGNARLRPPFRAEKRKGKKKK